jgi:hypothetical protein
MADLVSKYGRQRRSQGRIRARKDAGLGPHFHNMYALHSLTIGPPAASDSALVTPATASENRRGVLILISLVMLTLFLLLGTTYMVVTTRRRPCTAGQMLASQTAVHAKRLGERPDLLIGGGLIPYGSPSVPSDETRRVAINAFSGSALLLDKYGESCDRFQFDAPILANITEPLVEMTTAGMSAAWDDNGDPAIGGSPVNSLNPRMFVLTLVEVEDEKVFGAPYAGRILTIQRETEQDRNLAFRVVCEVGAPANSGATRTFLVHQLNPAPSVKLQPTGVADDALQVLIQGREFGRTGLNEDWDAPDEANLHLAWIPTEAVLGPDERPDDSSSGGVSDAPAHAWRHVIPSFHRPDRLLAGLRNYANPSLFDYRAWLGYPGGSSALSDRSGSVLMLRPAGPMEFHPQPDVRWDRMGFSSPPSFDESAAWEHPNFTGSNVRIINGVKHYFDPINGPWDVDNDGDGVADSIWIDIGAPVVNIDGVECRPLVAMLITDLDSRVNLNVHGSLVDSKFGSSEFAPQPATGTGAYYAGTAPTPPAEGDPAPSPEDEPPTKASLPPGQGWGVADINPAHLLAANDGPGSQAMNRAIQRFRRVLGGAGGEGPEITPRGISVPQVAAEGRYGDAVDGSGALEPAPGRLGVADPPIDAPSGMQARLSYLPNQFASPDSPLGSPIDPLGNQRVGLDQMGQPVYSRYATGNAPNPWQADRIDTPYDMSLGRSAPRPGWLYDPDAAITKQPSSFQDNLFTGSQLEKVLRLFEGTTSTLSPRLGSLLGRYSELARLTVTTESWDTTAACVPAALFDKLLDLSDQNPKQIGEKRPSLLSWDLQLGVKMDINRPFGDGTDNSATSDPGYRVVDEPGEYATESQNNVFGLAGSAFAAQALTNGRDVNGDGTTDVADQDRARELYARHLYVLAILASEGVWGAIEDTSAYRRQIAQWAVNVADFRDPDSIMTRFQYDDSFSPATETSLPSSTWTIDEETSPVVWGCERPELLITEALAWRNIREDGGNQVPHTWTDTGTGGLVFELYHPWTSSTTEGKRANPLPAELAADTDGKNSRYEFGSTIDLSKNNPDGQPVFQLVVVDDDASDDVDDLRTDPTWPRDGEKPLRRVIYLGTCDPAELNGLPKDAEGKQHIPRSAAASDPTTIQPGQFAIIGGPTKNGAGPLILPIQNDPNAETAGLEFLLDSFSDTEPVEPLQLTDGLAETITAVSADGNALDATNRKTARVLPKDVADGPIGALLCVGDATNVDASPSIRLPRGPTGSPDLNYIRDARFRVLLRRLANPLLAYDGKLNPYVTIDSLTFQDHGVIHSGAGSTTPYGSEQLTICSTERAASQQPPDGERPINNLWRSADADRQASLDGHLTEYGKAAAKPPFEHCGRISSQSTIRGSLGFLPAQLRIPAEGQNDIPAFPWLTWLNRDFASVHELLLVPGSNPATLLFDHSHEWPFAHLFFSGGPDAASLPADQLEARIGVLEFLRVAPRFADGELIVPPSHAVAVSDALIAAGGVPLLLPPHNYLSNFREPGRINVNTLSSPAVWDAVNNGRPTAPFADEFRVTPSGGVDSFVSSEDWKHGPRSGRSGNWVLDKDEDDAGNGRNANVLDLGDDANNDGSQTFGIHRTIASSRRGWSLTDSTDAPVEEADDLPKLEFAGTFDRILNRRGISGSAASWFANPFQSGWGDDDGNDLFSYGAARSLLLRAAPGTAADRAQMLLRRDAARKDSLDRDVYGFPYADPSRNPYFHYESVLQLSNKLTPRSNVYAVWMTVGFFALDQNGRLGEEYGIQTGDSRRHKTFMIIDRSIPVGFEPHGYEGNCVETILWRHFAN